ncbi:MAG TPA: carboxypeptidase regulatory-like domain-containing protein [Vicinamibacterales bacterium]|jgi:hypothetical protein|nr:carboxypeptidase regulatory-like domain-containing protein [Vicinamibacterales bacterium]
MARRVGIVVVQFAATACSMLVASAAFAQSGIAGSVKDATGAVMPGVTVEVTSPALIEKSRSVVTDDKGEYKIVDLVTGAYAVTFSLPGFTTVTRTGIELTAAFTATVNAEMRVGAIEESVTVSGTTPLVDTHSVTEQKPITSQMIQDLPTGRLQQGYAAMVVGVYLAPSLQDVGGTKGETVSGLQIHNSRQSQMADLLDGIPYNSMMGAGGGASGLKINMGAVQEINLGLTGNSAEYELGGVQYNVIPKDGGNIYSGTLFVNGANRSFQSNNIDAGLQARGINDVGHVVKLWDVNPTFGGPLMKDRLWYYLGYRNWGNTLGVTGTYYNLTPTGFKYTPDLSQQGYDDTTNRSATMRLSWQVSPKNKFSLFYDNEKRCTCHVGISTQSTSAVVSPEAAGYRYYEPDYQLQGSWTMPATNRLLLQAGFSATIFTPSIVLPESTATPDIYSALEISTGTLFRAATIYDTNISHTFNQRFAVSYITGSHAVKAGVQMQEGNLHQNFFVNQDINIRLLNGKPSQVVQWATPYSTYDRLGLNLGIYAQDSWTIHRLTLDPGVRIDHVNSYLPPSDNPATRFVQARSYAEIDNVPNWWDVDPRFGAAYDLFGNAKTAIKGNIGRYVIGETALIARALNPVTAAVNSVTRTWTDPSGTFNPYNDCNLSNPLANGGCGQISNLSFGNPTANVTYDPSVLNGWGVRNYNWAGSVGVQHEFSPLLSIDADYSHTWYGNPLAGGAANVFGFSTAISGSFVTPVKNLKTTPADYSPYCVTAPADPRLPNGGGYQICGLYDVNPNKFGQVQNLVTSQPWTEVFDGVDLSFVSRMPGRKQLSGGVSTGRIHLNACTVVNSPGDLRFCDIGQPLQTQFKLNWVYPLPWDLQLSGTYQNLPGTVQTALATYTNAQIAPSLGRSLSAGPNATVQVQLIAPESMYEPRRNQLDLRFVRNFRLGKARIQPQFDIYNVTNANSVQVMNTNYGPQWLTPTVVLPARLIKLGVQMAF